MDEKNWRTDEMAKKVIDLEKIRHERESELIRRLAYYGEFDKLSQIITRGVWRDKRVKNG